MSFFFHSLLSYTLRWRQFTTWRLLCDFPSLGRTFFQSVGNVENGWKGDFLFSFLVLADLQARGFKMRVKTAPKWKSRFQVELVSMPAPRHTRDRQFIWYQVCDWLIHVRQLRDLNHFQVVGQEKRRKSKIVYSTILAWRVNTSFWVICPSSST